MAAPNTVYLDAGATRVPIHIEGEIKLDTYPALKLVEYGTSIKELFFLDAWLMVDDGQGKSGFIGIIKDIPGSLNYRMHTLSRWFKVRLEVDGQRYIAMNDAGLNTLGRVTDTPLSYPINIETFNVNSFTSYAAYYVNGSYGFETSINDGVWKRTQISGQSAKETTNTPVINIADYFEWQAYVKLRPYHENAEGVFYGAVISTQVLAAPLLAGYNVNFASNAFNDTVKRTVYYTIRGLLMSRLWTDEIAQNPALTGYYVKDAIWYEYKLDEQLGYAIITRRGNCIDGQYPAGDPGNTVAYTEVHYYSYSAFNSGDACNARYAPVTLYLRKSDQKYFKENTLTQVANNGYYIEDSLTKGWFLINGGKFIDSGSC